MSEFRLPADLHGEIYTRVVDHFGFDPCADPAPAAPDVEPPSADAAVPVHAAEEPSTDVPSAPDAHQQEPLVPVSRGAEPLMPAPADLGSYFAALPAVPPMVEGTPVED